MLWGVVILAIAACGGEQGKLKIRPTPTPLAAGHKPVPFRIAEARGHFALGNVALALESFRKAAREDPTSTDALAGIAACYDRMGRFDLSRRNYEAALAIAPGDPQLLGALAASLDQQGRRAEAAEVRGEIAVRLAAAAPQPAAIVAVPEAKPEMAAAVPVPAPVPVAVVQPTAPPPVPVAAAPQPPAPVAAAPAGRSVTIALPPPRPVSDAPRPKTETAAAKPQIAAPAPIGAPPVGRSVTIALPPPRPVQKQLKPVAPMKVRTALVADRGPRVERLSLAEVALITVSAPQWRTPEAVRQAQARPAGVRILNAARVDRLAARTRSYLDDRGWRKTMIGDAAVTRSRSLIVYPATQRAVAARLSKQLGIAMAERQGVRMVTILLGRDAAGLAALRARGG